MRHLDTAVRFSLGVSRPTALVAVRLASHSDPCAGTERPVDGWRIEGKRSQLGTSGARRGMADRRRA